LGPAEFDSLIDAFIDRPEPDTLSFAVFEQATNQLAEQAIVETIEVTGVIHGDEIQFDVTETAPVITHGNEVLIGGLRLIVRLRQPEAA
jgi:hypothetical protein